MKLGLQITFALLAVIAVLDFSSCSSCSSNLSPGRTEQGAAVSASPRQFYTPPGAVYKVTYTPDTVRIDLPTVEKALRSVSPDGRVFVFNSTDPRISGLTQGKVLLLEHLGVRRIVAVQHQGSQTDLLTAPASLTDFIQDGHIEFKVPDNLRAETAQAEPPYGLREPPDGVLGWLGSPAVAYAEEPNKAKWGFHTKGEIDSWQYEISGEPEADNFSLTLVAIKKLAGFGASITTKGEISHVSTDFNATVEGGKMKDFEYSTPLEGNLHVSWNALTSGSNSGVGEARLKLPPFAKDVIDIYGIPFLFRIDEQLIFKPGFGTPHDAAEGGFTVNYTGSEGLSVKGSQSTPSGKMKEQPSLENTTSESLAAHGVVLAINAPKVSISLGTDSILESIKETIPGALQDKIAQVIENGPFGLKGIINKAKEDFFKLEGAAYVQLVSEFDYSSSGPLSLVPCKITHLNFYAQAGADAQLGMLKGESPHVDIDKSSLYIRDPNSPICGQQQIQ